MNEEIGNYQVIMENKLILICSDLCEGSTDLVCSWLNFYNKDFLRISNKNVITIKSIILNDFFTDFIFDIDETEYKLSSFKSYWYRRSNLNFRKLNKIEFSYEGINISDSVNNFISDEYEKIIEFFNFKLNEIALLNKYEDNNINKLNVLYVAKKLGINIPYTYISNNFKQINFRKESYITKAIGDLVINSNNKDFFSMTQRVDYKDETDEIGFSLIQKEIKKRFEIRTFFFNNTFYSSAIFSQENPKTQLDFRNYDDENPNRTVPFNLPISVEKKLNTLMSELKLNTGSLDLILTPKGDFYLLEINPTGQFGMVSFPCNYYLEKKIALNLINL